MREVDLVPPVIRHLEASGHSVWRDPDGTDYLDIVSLGPQGVGLVELKVRNPRQLVAQGLRRRTIADWVAVGLPTHRMCRSAVELANGTVSERLGIWWIRMDEVTVVRPARPFESEASAFVPTRARFRILVEQVASGVVPPGVLWGDVRSYRERCESRSFPLDEFEAPA